MTLCLNRMDCEEYYRINFWEETAEIGAEGVPAYMDGICGSGAFDVDDLSIVSWDWEPHDTQRLELL